MKFPNAGAKNYRAVNAHNWQKKQGEGAADILGAVVATSPVQATILQEMKKL